MTEYLYKVVLEGTIKEGFGISATRENLAKLLKVPASKATGLLRAEPTVIKRNANQITAKKIKQAIEKTGACCRIEATTQSNQQVNQVCANQSKIVQGVNQEAMSDTETTSTEPRESIANNPIQSVSDGTTIKMGFEKKEKSRKDSIAEKARRIAEKASSIASDASNNISKSTSITLNKSKIIASDFANSTTKGGQKAWKWTKNTGESIALQSKVKFKDDVNLMRQECGLLNNLTTTKSSPALFQSLLYASAGMGLLSNNIELARLSKKIMDVNSSPHQKLIEMMFDKTEVKEISNWMDTVPGFNAIGVVLPIE